MESDSLVSELFELFDGKNIFDVSLDIIAKFFYNISVKEILKLCRVNKKFNSVCQRESLWRNKVLLDYGIKKKYGRTWKERAIESGCGKSY